MFALVDCNNFYASCERVFRPDLRNRPVAVLSNNDGCLIARSNEVKALGVGMAQPYFKVRELLHRHRVTIFSSNYTLYGDMSRRVNTVLAMHAPNMEIYSIDEAFLHLHGFPLAKIAPWCRRLRAKVLRWTGIPVSIGVAPTKTLAKIANHMAKQDPQSQGVCVLHDENTVRRSLVDLPVSEIWGVGRRLTPKLELDGILTAGQLRDSDPIVMGKKYSVMMQRTVRELRGEACIQMEEVVARKQILTSRSFGSLVQDYASLRAAVCSYVSRCAEKLRDQDSVASAIMVFVRTSPHKGDFYSNHCVLNLPRCTQDTALLIKNALAGLSRIYRKGFHYQKAGVMLLDLSPRSGMQLGLFGRHDDSRSQALMQTMDRINRQMGRQTLHYGSEGIRYGFWQMRSSMRSPAYTTDWRALPRVR